MKKFVLWASMIAGIIISLATIAGFALWATSGFAASSGDAEKQWSIWKKNGLPTVVGEVDQRGVPDSQNAFLPLFTNKLGVPPFSSTTLPRADDLYFDESFHDGTAKAFFETHEMELDRIAAATNLSAFDPQRDWDQGYAIKFSEYSTSKAWVKFLCLDAHYRSRNGDFGGAIARLKAARRLTAFCAQDSTLISLLVAFASEALVLRWTGMVASEMADNPSALQSLHQMMNQTEWQPNYEQVYRGVAYLQLVTARNVPALELYQQFTNSGYVTGKHSGPIQRDGLPRSASSRAVAAEIMRYWNEFYPRVQAGETDIKLGRDMEARAAAMANSGLIPQVIASGLQSNYASIYVGQERMFANRLTLNAFLVTLRYRQQHDRWPASLAEAGLSPAESTDLLTGGPLGYRAKGSEVRVWNVGLNKTDQGGIAQVEAKPNGPGYDEVYLHPWPKARRKPVSTTP